MNTTFNYGPVNEPSAWERDNYLANEAKKLYAAGYSITKICQDLPLSFEKVLDIVIPGRSGYEFGMVEESDYGDE